MDRRPTMPTFKVIVVVAAAFLGGLAVTMNPAAQTPVQGIPMTVNTPVATL